MMGALISLTIFFVLVALLPPLGWGYIPLGLLCGLAAGGALAVLGG